MRSIIIGAAFALALAGTASADTYVRGHVKTDGTYVQGHYKTSPNQTRNDNYSTRGNTNPYTGTSGTKPRDSEWTYKPASSGSSSGKKSASAWGY